MGYEMIVFTILTVLVLGSGLVAVFHIKPKELSARRKTAHGLISLTLGAWATVTLLIMGGFI
jgi:Na+/proline symporter